MTILKNKVKFPGKNNPSVKIVLIKKCIYPKITIAGVRKLADLRPMLGNRAFDQVQRLFI